MRRSKSKPRDARSADKRKIRALYQALLDGWNGRAARKIAALFAADGNLVGFDGSVVNGPEEIESHIGRIFSDHATPAYVAIVRDVRFLSPATALLRAVAGMVPPGQSDIHPPINAVQTLVAAKQAGRWRIALFQNTPAAFHGRPELSAQLTAELRRAFSEQSK